ncbi:hypothetical protein LTS16_019917 [Friedmanniomyces endolithicus]|uniref:Mitotic-spindle organizing protein 1 n=1 Tax=Friedmanniomyces endolithicus TaxID=329885 RepID=A0AAN6J0W9_9PEZI|nr:hypothetical protein LTR82_016733 [Friedmanniomyces endolithicus]KAK0926185.1 hypothetical protein LTR57_004436 [Friedmanniomyces endolithicus]KAK0977196.1 hypothetical protein LTS01_013198 [Friedmanniomyces endolithicus]KAK1029224.1 hypothetical protein LTS16_019917 [Friedmanniomyces endolithicus]
MPAADDSKRKAARETIDILHEISTLLVRNKPPTSSTNDCWQICSRLLPANPRGQNTNLDRQSLSYCVSLIENGVNPEALAVPLPPRLATHDLSSGVLTVHARN